MPPPLIQECSRFTRGSVVVRGDDDTGPRIARVDNLSISYVNRYMGDRASASIEQKIARLNTRNRDRLDILCLISRGSSRRDSKVCKNRLRESGTVCSCR